MHNVIMYYAQGQDTAPVYISTRIVFFFMFLASVVLFESFRTVKLLFHKFCKQHPESVCLN